MKKTKNKVDRPKTSLKQKLLLVVISIFVVLFAFEIGIRIHDVFKGRPFFSNFRNRVANAGDLLPFRTFGPKFYSRDDGKLQIRTRYGETYSLPKKEGMYRIVVFGASTTANGNCYNKSGEHYPMVLQKLLRQGTGRDNIEVINVGIPGYATPHSLILLELDVLSWQPDMVIISHNFNDLQAAYFPDFTPDYANKYSNGFYGVPNVHQLFSLPNILFQYSQLYWRAQTEWENLKVNVRAEFKPVSRKPYGDEPPAAAAQAFARNLRSFAALAQKNGIEVVLGNQALLPGEEPFTRYMKFKEYNDEVVYPLHQEFVLHHKRYNQIIKEVAEETGALFVDNDAALGADESYFADFIHYTCDGVHKVAEDYAAVILGSGLLDRK